MEPIVNVDSTKLINPDTSLVTGSSVEKKLFEYFKLYYHNLEDEPISKFSKDVLNIIYSGKPPNDDYGEIYNFYRPIEFVNKVYKILSNIRIMILNQFIISHYRSPYI